MSFAYTIMRGTAPLLTSLFMLLSGHEMPLAGWLGILCLCAGVLTLTCDNIKSGRFQLRGALAAVGTAVVTMGYTLFDGYGAQASGNPISYVCWLYVINTFPINLILLLRQRKTYIPYFRTRWKHGLFGGLCSLGSYGVALWAMTKAPIAMVAALRETSVIFGMLLAVFFLGEAVLHRQALPSSSVGYGIFFMHSGNRGRGGGTFGERSPPPGTPPLLPKTFDRIESLSVRFPEIVLPVKRSSDLANMRSSHGSVDELQKMTTFPYRLPRQRPPR